jgi:hypothetical protein
VDAASDYIEATGGTRDTLPVMFSEAVPVDGGQRLEVRFSGGLRPCFVLDHVEVDETADAVTVTLFAGHDASVHHVACSRARRLLRTVIELRAPLGKRTVRDGSQP